MPTARLGEEMPGSNALHTDLHTLVRTTTDTKQQPSVQRAPHHDNDPKTPIDTAPLRERCRFRTLRDPAALVLLARGRMTACRFFDGVCSSSSCFSSSPLRRV